MAEQHCLLLSFVVVAVVVFCCLFLLLLFCFYVDFNRRILIHVDNNQTYVS